MSTLAISNLVYFIQKIQSNRRFFEITSLYLLGQRVSKELFVVWSKILCVLDVYCALV